MAKKSSGKSGKKSRKTSGKKSEKKKLKALRPLVSIVMGSDSDLRVMEEASETLKHFGVRHEIRILSAHRTPEVILEYASKAFDRGLKVLIAGAGGAAHLPGMLASATILPVIGVPVNVTKLDGIDAFLSIVQMPKGVPVATVAIDNASNAALLAVRMLATEDASLARALISHRKAQGRKVRDSDRALRDSHRR